MQSFQFSSLLFYLRQRRR